MITTRPDQPHRLRPHFALLAFALLLPILSACADTRALVIFTNESACQVIAVQLRNTETGEVLTDRLQIGVRREFELKPDVFYEYEVDFTAAGTMRDNMRCTGIERGRVRVPAGARQTFPLRSETPVPTPVTPTP